MNHNNFLLETAQQGFLITVGAATSFLETIQNPQKCSRVISQLQLEFNQKTREWLEKGTVTEQEAKTFINHWLNQNTGVKTPSTNAHPSNTNNDVNWGLQELQAEIIALRIELEKMRQARDSN